MKKSDLLKLFFALTWIVGLIAIGPMWIPISFVGGVIICGILALIEKFGK